MCIQNLGLGVQPKNWLFLMISFVPYSFFLYHIALYHIHRCARGGVNPFPSRFSWDSLPPSQKKIRKDRKVKADPFVFFRSTVSPDYVLEEGESTPPPISIDIRKGFGNLIRKNF